MELCRGDKLFFRRSVNGPTEEASVDEITILLDNNQLGCNVLLAISGKQGERYEKVGVFLLNLWVEWAN